MFVKYFWVILPWRGGRSVNQFLFFLIVPDPVGKMTLEKDTRSPSSDARVAHTTL